MRKHKSQKTLDQERKIKDWFAFIGLGFIIFTLLFGSIQSVFADQITHKFKSPSFNGVGTSSHYLTIENQEYSRKLTLKEELKAIQDEIERDKENTTLARFVRNLESRIYAQLSRQLVENLFGDVTKTSGTLELENNLISYTSDGVTITLTITDPDGTTTEISLPIGSFTF